MRVWIDGSPLQNGHRFRGIGAYARGLLEGLASLDVDLQITLGLWRSHPQPDLEPLPPGRIEVAFLPMWSASRGIIPLTQQLIHPAIIRRHRVDVVHQLGLVADPAAGAPMVGYPGRTVVTIHDLTPLQMPLEFLSGHRLRRWFYAGLVAGARRADVVVADTECVAADLVAHGFQRSRLRVAPLAVDPKLRTALSEMGAARGLIKGLPSSFVLAVNMGHPNKGLSVLEDALRLLPEEIRPGLVATGLSAPSHHGPGTAFQFLPLGHLSELELAALYRSAVCCVVPSNSEGFGLPVVEAMTAGTPVVASDAPALVEVAGGAAEIFRRGDSAELSTKLQQVLGSDAIRKRLSTLGRARAATFTWRRTAELTYAAYRAAMASR